MLKQILVNVCRFILAVTFIFSGFVKLVDPTGGLYKFQEYFAAFGIGNSIPTIIILTLSTLLAVLEFTLGASFLFGIRRRLTTWFSLFFMLFMTALTLFLAVTDAVSDCGCFGDAWVLSNWETFFKNLILLSAAVITFKFRKLINSFISHKSQWLISLYTAFYGSVLALYCLMHLPILDFRPYKIGKNIADEMTIPEGETPSVYETYFILEKDGVRKEFSLNNYPDSTWSFVDTRTVLKSKGFEPSIHDFSLLDYESGDNVTDDVLNDSTYTFFLIASRLDNADDSNIDLINEIYDYSNEHGYRFYCLTSSTDEDIETWRDMTGAEYPILLADDIMLKTMIRSNPGLMLIKQGTILNKWNDDDIPDEYVLNNKPLDELTIGQAEPVNVKKVIFLVILWYFVPLLLVLGIDQAFVHHMASTTANKVDSNTVNDTNNEDRE